MDIDKMLLGMPVVARYSVGGRIAGIAMVKAVDSDTNACLLGFVHDQRDSWWHPADCEDARGAEARLVTLIRVGAHGEVVKTQAWQVIRQPAPKEGV